MKLDEALDILTQVCSGYRGTGPEHDMLREALKTVDDKCKAPKVPKKSEKVIKADS